MTKIQISLILLFNVVVTSKAEGCIKFTSSGDASGRIFDDDRTSTCMLLPGGQGEAVNTISLEVNSTCVETADLDFDARLSGQWNCSELNFLFTPAENPNCKRRRRCRGFPIELGTDTTDCLIRCPKKAGVKHTYEVEIIYGLYHTNWNLCDLRVYKDECKSHPCSNGGTCEDKIDAFTCTCAVGFTGSTCEESIDDCESSPCENSGICRDGINSYHCDCLPGYTGLHCETDIDECELAPCSNFETCSGGINTYSCQCNSHAFGGNKCQIDCNNNSWTRPSNWPAGDSPILYWSFQTDAGIGLINGASIGSGKVCTGVKTNLVQRQYVQLGNMASLTCLTKPDTCGTRGASVSLWIKLTDCPHLAGVLTSRGREIPHNFYTQGFVIRCQDDDQGNQYLAFLIAFRSGYHFAYCTPTFQEWFHTAFVLNELNGGLTIYENGVDKASDPHRTPYDFGVSEEGSGFMTIGRELVFFDGDYFTGMVDELTVWNRTLSGEEIREIYEMY